MKLSSRQKSFQNLLQKANRYDKRQTGETHTVLVTDQGRRYQLTGTLSTEESEALFEQTGIRKIGSGIEFGRGSFGRVRLVRDSHGTFFAAKKTKNNYFSSQFTDQCIEYARFENKVVSHLQDIEGCIKLVDCFTSEDSKGQEVVYSILEIANLGDAEQFTQNMSHIIKSPTKEKRTIFNELTYPIDAFKDGANPVHYQEALSEENVFNSSLYQPILGYINPHAHLLEKTFPQENLSKPNLHHSSLKERAILTWILETLEDDFNTTYDKHVWIKTNNLVLLHIAHSVINTLIKMHKKNIFHRDVCLRNILLSTTGDIYLCDFGCSFLVSQDESQGAVLQAILPPELFLLPSEKRWHLVNQSTFANQAIDAWQTGIMLISFLPGHQVLKLFLTIKSNEEGFLSESDRLRIVDHLSRVVQIELQRLFKTNNVPKVLRQIIAGLLNPQEEERMSLTEAASLFNQFTMPNQSLVASIFERWAFMNSGVLPLDMDDKKCVKQI